MKELILKIVLFPLLLWWLMIGAIDACLMILFAPQFGAHSYSSPFWDGVVMGYLLNLYFGIKV